MIAMLHRDFDSIANADLKKRIATAIGKDKEWKKGVKQIADKDVKDWLSGLKVE